MPGRALPRGELEVPAPEDVGEGRDRDAPGYGQRLPVWRDACVVGAPWRSVFLFLFYDVADMNNERLDHIMWPPPATAAAVAAARGSRSRGLRASGKRGEAGTDPCSLPPVPICSL